MDETRPVDEPTTPPSRRRRAVFATLAMALPLLLAEGLLRLVNPPSLHFVHAARQVHAYSPRHGTDLRPGSAARLRLATRRGTLYDFVLTVDADGRRTSDRALLEPRRPRPAARLVHCIGDSFTMGWGVAHGEAYPTLLGLLLAPGWEVQNHGVDGFGAIAATERSRETWQERRPDHVVYLFLANDFADDAKLVALRRRDGLYHGARRALDALRRVSYLADLPFAVRWHRQFATVLGELPAVRPPLAPAAARLVRRPDDAKPPRDVAPPAAAEPTLDAVTAFARDAERHGVRFTVVVPFPDEPEGDAAWRHWRARGLDVHRVPVPHALRLPGDGHFDLAGNWAMARYVATEVVAAPARR